MSLPRLSSRLSTLVVATVAGLTLAGCDAAVEDTPPAPAVSAERSPAPRPESSPTTASPTTTSPASAGAPNPAGQTASAASSEALARLATLPIKGRAPKTGYDRDLFGQAWSDDVSVEFGGNGCDTRNDILRRDLVDIVYKPGTRDCVVASGTLDDRYTGTTIAFTRGQDTSSAVQIDHVVALSDAWQKGAQQLDAGTRADFANDPRNLQAVDGPANQQKGDGDAATWLPPNRAYRCTYVARQIEVKAIYGLWVTQAEHDAMARVLTECGGGIPAAATTTNTPAPAPEPAPAPAPAQPEPLAPAPSAPAEVYFENCAAARAAGAAPLYAGQPGYRPKMDGDGDGVACE
ncbi:DUF1524 domain-containing protein [Rhodococcus sp. NPDC047139]|uniref:GmrSD restriction endonuclease domain-containing protein n=1 Tax=Rhodococcus sp. NPDC047139 TaxID=3155141 RepID=UPI0033E1BEF6